MKNRLVHPAVAKASGIGALVGTVAVWGISLIPGVDLPAEVSGAIVGIFTYLGAFLPGQ